MRILIVGAGAIGGYFGARLLAAKRDVTFLVRPRRAQELGEHGLVLKSPLGDVTIADPPRLLANEIDAPFDLVLLSCKAFDLDDAIASFKPAVGSNTAIIPLLNGMAHLKTLDDAFGAERVLGGQCAIAVTLNAAREIVHLAPMQSLSFGERDGQLSSRVQQIARAFAVDHVAATASQTILQEMWEKWVFLATLAAATSAMRATLGAILASPGGRDLVLGLRDECAAVAEAAGHAPREAFLTRTEGMLTTEGSPLTASMYRDIQAGARIEADHVIGDLIARADASKSPAPRLRMAYTHLKAYEAQRN